MMLRTVPMPARIVALLLALIAAGCGTNPLDPAGPAPGGVAAPVATGPEVLVIRPDGSVRYTHATDEGGPSPARAGESNGRTLKTSEVIDGAKGGALRCGRFALRVPAGAWSGEGTVTMAMSDSTVMIVDLEIAPAELNNFQKPVDLAITTTNAEVHPDSLQLYHYNPESKEWESLSCDKNLEDEPVPYDDPYGEGSDDSTQTTRGLQTPLTHFSRYSSGKAGW